ncbi:MAG: ArsR/SmtB family transcription factor [Chthoniobacterales bacterium]|jgi:DNA-binding transcriptional ArsR family regulator
MAKINQRQLNRMADLFATLSDPARLRILNCLRTGPRSVGDIHRTCHLKQANTSKHLRVLREARLVSPRREGTTVRYAISEPLIFGLCDLACGGKIKNGHP